MSQEEKFIVSRHPRVIPIKPDIQHAGKNWEVSVQFEGQKWVRQYHYKVDATRFADELSKLSPLDQQMFHPLAYHMWIPNGDK